MAKASWRSQFIKWALRMDLILVGRDGLKINESRKNRYLKQQQNTENLEKVGEKWKSIMVCMLGE